MAEEATRTLQWVEKIFVACNEDSTFEFEIKFCDRFQGLVSEDPAEFQVGVNAFLFHQIIAHYRAQPEVYAEEHEEEVVQYLSSRYFSRRCGTCFLSFFLKPRKKSASEISGSILANNSVFQRYGTDVRVVSQPGVPRFVMIKTRIKQLPDAQQSVLPEGFKMSLSKEAILADEEAVSICATFDELPAGVFTRRDKKRTSFVQTVQDEDHNSIRVLKIDFTAVSTSFGENDVTDLDSPPDNIRYEIELEYIGNKNPQGGTNTLQESQSLRQRIARLFFDNIHQLIRLIQGSPIPLNNMAHNAVIRNYLESVGNNDPYAESAGIRPSSKDMFVGCQPESLHERHLPSLVRERYFVTSKTDGLRFQMIAIPQPEVTSDPTYRMRCYLIDRWMHVQPSGLRIAVPNAAVASETGLHEGFLLDGELVTEPNGSETYWPFDVLRFGSTDMRPRLTFARIEVLKKIVAAVQKFGVKAPNRRLPPMTVQMKDMIFWPSGEASSGDLIRLMEQCRTPSDGLVCMRDEPHPRKRQWPGLLKWKGTASTVDLYVRENVAGKRWDFFVSGNFATIKRDGSRCLIFKKIPTEHKDGNLYWVLTPNGPTIIEHASRDLVWSDVRSCIPFPFCASIPSFKHVSNSGMVALEDKMVFEFRYDPQNKTLIPTQKRTDKSMRGLEGANDLRVAVDVWESMKYAVTKEQLLSLPSIHLSSASQSAVGTYPYIKDIDSRIDWKALFSGASQPVAVGGSSLSSSSPIVNLKQLHNRIKKKLIDETRKKKPLNSTDILKSLDGFVVSSRDRLQPTQVREWSLPKTARIALQKMWGLRPENIAERGDRIYVSERLLNGAKIVQPRETVVVDLCCGKGGDLFKYVRSDMSVLVCIDNEKSLLTDLKDSALRRWEEIRARDTFTDACFVLADCRQPLYQTLCDRGVPLEADVVSCFFALHYFFSCERDARSFLQNVKDLLKPDGVFIGTMVDGELMFEQLRKHNNSFTHLGGGIYPIFSVTAVNFDATAKEFKDLPPFGQHLDVELKSSILEQYSTAKADSAPGGKQEN